MFRPPKLNASHSLTILFEGAARPARKLRGAGGLRFPMLNTSRAYRGNNLFMTGEMGGSLMQMRRNGDFRRASPCQLRSGGPSSMKRHEPVTAKRGGQLDKTEDIIPLRPWESKPTAGDRKPPERVAFDRKELQTILGFYGTKVAEGEWRDYAMDFGREKAVFSVFRRASEVPLYRIVKDPALARRQGMYSVVAQGGLIMKRGHDLAAVLRVLAKTPKLTAL